MLLEAISCTQHLQLDCNTFSGKTDSDPETWGELHDRSNSCSNRCATAFRSASAFSNPTMNCSAAFERLVIVLDDLLDHNSAAGFVRCISLEFVVFEQCSHHFCCHRQGLHLCYTKRLPATGAYARPDIGFWLMINVYKKVGLRRGFGGCKHTLKSQCWSRSKKLLTILPNNKHSCAEHERDIQAAGTVTGNTSRLDTPAHKAEARPNQATILGI